MIDATALTICPECHKAVCKCDAALTSAEGIVEVDGVRYTLGPLPGVYHDCVGYPFGGAWVPCRYYDDRTYGLTFCCLFCAAYRTKEQLGEIERTLRAAGKAPDDAVRT